MAGLVIIAVYALLFDRDRLSGDVNDLNKSDTGRNKNENKGNDGGKKSSEHSLGLTNKQLGDNKSRGPQVFISCKKTSTSTLKGYLLAGERP